MDIKNILYNKIKYNKKGFTLIELIAVIIILGILVVIGMTNFGTSIDDSKNARVKSDFEVIATAEQKYYADMGVWPGTQSATGGKIADFNAVCTSRLQTSSNGKGPWITKCPSSPYPSGTYSVSESSTSFDICESVSGICLQTIK